MDDRYVINTFVSFLRETGYPGLQVERWPDSENRESSDIDAIAGVFAIEHTSIDTLPNQQRDSDWFMQAAGGFSGELLGKLMFRLRITLEYKAITKGQDWTAIREAIKKWITKEAPRLQDGRHVLDGIPKIPFRMHVTKACDRPPGVFFARFDPGDETIPDRIRELFDRKAKKLDKYKGAGRTTVLLVENDDFALMNKLKMLDSIRKVYPAGPPPAVDQIWYADTSIPEEIEFKNFTFDLLKKGRPT